MATSTLVNDLSSSSVACSSRRVVETYKVKAGVTITEGTWVALDKATLGVEGAKTVLIATNVLVNAIPVGVALTGTDGAAIAGTTIQVVTSGYYPTAKVAAGVAAGSPIMSAAAGSAVAFLATALTNKAVPCGYVTKLVPVSAVGEVIITCSPI